MDEPSGSTTHDLAGNTPGVLSGATSVTGMVARGRRIAPETEGGHLVVDGSGALNITGNQITIEAWVKLESHPYDEESYSAVFGKSSPPTNHAYLIYFQSGPGVALPPNQWQFSFALLAANGSRLQPNSGLVVSVDGQFHHFAMSYNGSEVRLYVDGSLQRTYAFSGNLKGVPNVPVSLAGRSWFSIDEPAIYDRALTALEIQTISAAGAFGKCKKPVIFDQPKSQAGLLTRQAKFDVTAFGSDPLKYQWQKSSLSITNGTNATLVLSNLQASTEGSYRVFISNEWGSVTSSDALLIVNPYGVSMALHPALTIDGLVGLTYGIQYNTALNATNNWQGLANITLSVPSQLWFDIHPATAPQRYYRVVPGPIPIP